MAGHPSYRRLAQPMKGRAGKLPRERTFSYFRLWLPGIPGLLITKEQITDLESRDRITRRCDLQPAELDRRYPVERPAIQCILGTAPQCLPPVELPPYRPASPGYDQYA